MPDPVQELHGRSLSWILSCDQPFIHSVIICTDIHDHPQVSCLTHSAKLPAAAATEPAETEEEDDKGIRLHYHQLSDNERVQHGPDCARIHKNLTSVGMRQQPHRKLEKRDANISVTRYEVECCSFRSPAAPSASQASRAVAISAQIFPLNLGRKMPLPVSNSLIKGACHHSFQSRLCSPAVAGAEMARNHDAIFL